MANNGTKFRRPLIFQLGYFRKIHRLRSSIYYVFLSSLYIAIRKF